MRKLVYELKDTNGKSLAIIGTLKEKKEAERLGFVTEEKLISVDTFQPWKKEAEPPKRKPSKYHKFVMDRYQ